MTDTADQTAVFPLLADPASYSPCKRELTASFEALKVQLDIFRHHFPTLAKEGKAEAEQRGADLADLARRYDAAQAEFFEHLDALEEDVNQFDTVNILTICRKREAILRAHGIPDPYRLAKRRETDQALTVLPRLLEELDAMPEAQRRVEVIRGVFAGNIFDLGAAHTVAMFDAGPVDFDHTRDQLRPRPWHTDDLDAWLTRLEGEPHRAAVLFIDNAGPDVVLGMLPLARFLLKRGTRVILTANAQPTLNDVTYPELVELIEHVAESEPTIAAAYHDGRLRLVSSGNDAPLIDLSAVSPDLAEMVREEDVDLVVIEGMGRALESNFDSPMSGECIKIAMVKNTGTAEEYNAEIFDLVFRYEP